jgi:NarL family two-component system response regulator LiaR
MTSSPIRVLLVDDHLMVRRGLATLLLAFNDVQLVGEAQNGAEALALCATAQPDVVLMDLLMPEMDGVEATHAIRERYPNIRVIVLTSMDEYDYVQRSLAAGAEGYLLKSISADDLAAAIRVAIARRPPRAPESFEDLARAAHLPDPAPPEPGAELTCREHDVLELLAHGLTNTQIGAHLNISRATVKFHVSSILNKLGVCSRTEAVALAVQHQLISGPDDIRPIAGRGTGTAGQFSVTPLT